MFDGSPAARAPSNVRSWTLLPRQTVFLRYFITIRPYKPLARPSKHVDSFSDALNQIVGVIASQDRKETGTANVKNDRGRLRIALSAFQNGFHDMNR